MECQVLVDWLTFSVKEKDPARVIQEDLGLDPNLFQDAGYSLLGYNRVLRFSDICVCYEPRENDFFKDMGVCVSMSGNGCRTFETISSTVIWSAPAASPGPRRTSSISSPPVRSTWTSFG